MTIYETTINTMKQTKSVSTHMTALGRIKAMTEDTILNAKLENVLQALRSAYLDLPQKGLPIEAATIKRSGIAQLMAYCTKQVEKKKPEWQVVAEREGWTSPKG